MMFHPILGYDHTLNRNIADYGWIGYKCIGSVKLLETKQKNYENANPIPVDNFVSTMYGRGHSKREREQSSTSQRSKTIT